MLPNILEFLEGYKAKDIQCLNVESMTPFVSTMIICTATSSTHAQSLSESLVQFLKSKDFLNTSKVEGTAASGWILIKLGFIVIHVMLAETRDLYQLETLWKIPNKIDSVSKDSIMETTHDFDEK